MGLVGFMTILWCVGEWLVTCPQMPHLFPRWAQLLQGHIAAQHSSNVAMWENLRNVVSLVPVVDICTDTKVIRLLFITL